MEDCIPLQYNINDTILLNVRKNHLMDSNHKEVLLNFILSSKAFLEIFDAELEVHPNAISNINTLKPFRKSVHNGNKEFTKAKKSEEVGEPIARIGNSPIHQNRIDEIRKHFPDTFTLKQLTTYFDETYPDLQTQSRVGKRCSYTQYMQNNDIIKVINRSGRNKTFQFNPVKNNQVSEEIEQKE
jgi:YesN/AraC family two-component response regulator